MMPASISSMLVSSLLTKKVRSRPGTAETSLGNSSSWKMYAISPPLILGPIRETCNLGVGHGCYGCPDLGLLVTFDRGLRRSTPLLAPHQRDLGAGIAMLDIHHGQRDHRALIIRVPGVGG